METSKANHVLPSFLHGEVVFRVLISEIRSPAKFYMALVPYLTIGEDGTFVRVFQKSPIISSSTKIVLAHSISRCGGRGGLIRDPINLLLSRLP